MSLSTNSLLSNNTFRDTPPTQILLGVMTRLGMERITVSEWGNLDGYITKYYCNS